jgi:hypothetical protein
MQRTGEIREKLESVFEPKQAAVLSEVIAEEYNSFVKTGDFNELKSIVKDISITLADLASAQKRTEKTVESLVIAQERTEIALKELVSEHKELVREHRETRKQVGGLSGSVGYGLEDKAYIALPGLLKRDFGIIVEGRLKRDHITDNKGKKIEVNIFGEAVLNGSKLTIVGEGKSQLSKNNIDEFISKKLKRLEGRFKEIFPVIVTYMTSEPEAAGYAKDKGITLYYSYDFSYNL